VKRLSPIAGGRAPIAGRPFTLHAPRSTLLGSRSLLPAPRSPLHAFTLVEILVTIALLAFITLGLFAALDQVQRAFKSGMGQVDRLEAGRAVTELLPRELEQVSPCGNNGATFVAAIIPNAAPLTQSLPGMPATMMRTNLLQDCFILTRQNQTWVGIGYCVRVSDANGVLSFPISGPGQLGVGSLYRYSASMSVLMSNGIPSDPAQLYKDFRKACATGSKFSQAISNRICDGVIHFYLSAYATNGFPIVSDGTRTNAYFRNNPFSLQPSLTTIHPARVDPNPSFPGNLSGLYFWSNAVPAAVGLELGILEQPAWERYNSLPVPAARLAYLQRPDVTSRVHLFRQRIPIRNVDPLAYQ
jgi:hypothetical protein